VASLAIRPAVFSGAFSAVAHPAGPISGQSRVAYGPQLLVALWCQGLGLFVAAVASSPPNDVPNLPVHNKDLRASSAPSWKRLIPMRQYSWSSQNKRFLAQTIQTMLLVCRASAKSLAQVLWPGVLAVAGALLAGINFGSLKRGTEPLAGTACGTQLNIMVQGMPPIATTPAWEFFASGGYGYWVEQFFNCHDPWPAQPGLLMGASGVASQGLEANVSVGASCDQFRQKICHVAVAVAVCGLLFQAALMYAAAWLLLRRKLSVAKPAGSSSKGLPTSLQRWF
jgi:hypothetical protein